MLQNIIPPRLKSVLAKRPPGLGRNWRKRALILGGVVLALFVIGHLGVRYVLWPQIQKSKASVEKLISTRTGIDVTIDDLKVSWTGIRPAFEMNGLRFNSPNKTKTLLSIEKIYGELSWNSFYHLAPYFHEIHFEGAEIYAQRNTKGAISVAGIPLDSNSSDYSAENWLFAQDSIEAKKVKLFWDDQQNKKAITSIEVLNLDLTNGIRRHDGSLIAITPWTKGPTEVKVNFVPHLGGQAGNWRDWIGTISWNLADLDLKQVSKEFNLGIHTLEGLLSSNGNLKIDNAQPDGGEFYVAVDKLVVQSAKSEDAIALGRLEANLVQETNDGLIAISTKTFAWRDMDSPKSAPLEKLSPMTFRWRPPAADGEIKEFGFSSPKISIDDATLFALNLPLSKKVHQWIKAAQAEGDLEDVDIHWSESKSALSALNIPGDWFKSNKLDFTVSAKLINLSFIGVNKSMPSVSNLSGFISSSQNEGSFSLNSKDLGLEINDFLEDPKIQLDRASGQISWAKKRGRWVVNTNKLSLSNPEINTNLSLNYIIGTPKEADFMALDMQFLHANAKTAYRYLPVGMGKDARVYLSKAFNAGTIQNGTLHIKGDPNQVPFPDKQQGEFSLNLPISSAAFTPVPLLPSNQGTWSTFTNVNGTVAMSNSSFAVDIPTASYKQVALSGFHAEIPNVSANQLTLSVTGKAQGQAPELLEYFYASPSGKKQDKIAQSLRVTGPIDLGIGLKVPLSGSADTNIDLKLTLPGNRAEWGDFPPFEDLKGNIRITESNPEFEDVSANFLGGSIKISSSDKNSNKQNFNIAGDIQASFLKTYLANSSRSQPNPMLNAMNGTIKYDGTISFNKLGSDSNLRFDLRDWSINAPAPVKKLAGAAMTGEVNIKTFASEKNNANRASWSGKIGELYSTQGVLGRDDELRYSLGIGAPPNLPQEGFNLNLVSSELNLDTWRDFLAAKSPSRAQEAESNTGNIQITAQVKKLTLFDRLWQDVNLSANNKKNVWDVKLGSLQASGQFQYQAANKNNTSGLISGRLTKLKIPDVISNLPTKPGSSNQATFTPDSIPSLDISIDDLSWSKARLGQIKIKTRTSDHTLKIDSIQSDNPQGSSQMNGQWNGSTKNEAEHSTLNIDMDVKDAGQIIAHWTSQKSIEGGHGKVSANVEWDGSPFNPQYETLSGKASLNLEKGRLLEVNTSGAKILDVLSLQSLFKFATLDIQGGLGNIVTKGTPFNSITSNFDISNGVAQAKQFNMNLDQARVAMAGQINLSKQTQDLRITIFPTIDATAGSLAAFAINPIVGLGALVGQYLLTSQINRSFQSDYLVQGSWDNPEVIPLDQKGQPIDTQTFDSIRKKELLMEQSKPSSNSTPNNSGSDTQTTN
jgi:uncharacterized protein (TIGR02099 family)